MPDICHQFGDLSTGPVTILAASPRHRFGDNIHAMKGKYPNGLKAAMERAGVGPTKLAKAAETSKQNIDRLADGSRELTGIWAESLAPHLGVAPEQLVFPNRRPVIRVPWLSWVAAGKLSMVDSVTAIDAKKYVTIADLPPGGGWIALTVDGDSMDRIAPPGAVILVNRHDQQLVEERYYVFSTEDGRATFKRYRGSPSRMQPYSNNPDHETQHLTEATSIVGRVRRVIIDLK